MKKIKSTRARIYRKTASFAKRFSKNLNNSCETLVTKV